MASDSFIGEALADSPFIEMRKQRDEYAKLLQDIRAQGRITGGIAVRLIAALRKYSPPALVLLAAIVLASAAEFVPVMILAHATQPVRIAPYIEAHFTAI